MFSNNVKSIFSWNSKFDTKNKQNIIVNKKFNLFSFTNFCNHLPIEQRKSKTCHVYMTIKSYVSWDLIVIVICNIFAVVFPKILF